MKKSISGLTIAEVAVSMVVFSLSLVYMTKLQAQNIEAQMVVDKEIKIKRYSEYVRSFVEKLTIPAYPDGQEFYIEENYSDPSLYTFTTADQISSEMPIGFFRPSELFDYSHKITKIDENSVGGINYITYKIEVSYDDDIEEYYVIK